MVRGDPADQERTVARAIAAGVNYFDTAVQYGDGESEKNLGRVLQTLRPANATVGTKVRLPPGEFGRIADAVTKSLEGSLARLRLDRVDILHLHNAIADEGGGSALSVRQVLDDVVPAFERLRQQGKIRFLGITAVGDTAALQASAGCPRLRQRPNCLQHAQSICRRGIAGELSGTELWTVVRSHPVGRCWVPSSSSRNRSALWLSVSSWCSACWCTA